MAGGALERRIEDAELATGAVIGDQRRRVEGAVPIRLPAETQRLEASTAAAMDSTSSLAGEQASRVRAFLGSLRLSRLQSGGRAEARYQQAEQGFERPARVITALDDARADSESFLESGQERVPGVPAAAERPGAAEYRDSNQEVVDELSREVSEEWMTREYLGDTVYDRFSECLPFATLETMGWFGAISLLSGTPIGGLYLTGSNHIAVSRFSGDSAYLMMAHEQLHYAAFLGGGGAMRWRDEGGAPHLQEELWKPYEGMTELLAQQLTRAHGHEPPSVAYPYETAVSFAMQQVVGEEPLRRAYFSGDFTEVRRLADERLGAGTFDALMACSSAPDAFSLIMGKVSAAGIDYHSWESNPVMAQCHSQIAVERFR